MDSLPNIFKFCVKICVKQKMGIALAAGIILVPALFVLAQTDSPQNTSAPVNPKITAALDDLSRVYGQPVTRIDQARAICNLEKYLTDCAQIGKKYELFAPEEVKQVDAVLKELKGKMVEDLKKCADETCLLSVANRLASQLVNKNPALAKELDFTTAKIQEKRTIVETAKKAGVDIGECRTADPDTAPVELLRACAKLARSKEIQRYLPEETRRIAEVSDRSLELKDALQKGDYRCGDGTLDGCGNFCLNPTAEGSSGGAISIPMVCREIAQRFFGQDGVRELESAYTKVLSTTDYYNKRAENIVFITSDGKTITNPADIGKYLEGEMKKGNVEAIEKGMDFMVSRGFVKSQDKDFALSMVRKIKEQGGAIDFDACAQNPKACSNFIPEDRRQEFDAMEEVHDIVTQEMRALGVSSPDLCDSNPQLGEQCLRAAQTALSKVEEVARKYPNTQFIVNDIRQKISFGNQGLEARRRAEEQFRKEGGQGLAIGDKVFNSFVEMEAFCRDNGSICLAEAAKKGLIGRDYAASKYEHTYDIQYGPSEHSGFQGTGPYPGFTPPGTSGALPPGQMPGFTSPGPGFNAPSGFNKEEALKKFQAWLDNPQDAPPIPSFGMPYQPPGGQYGIYPQPGQGNQQPYGGPACAIIYPKPCPDGQYRQESRDSQGCFAYSECVSVSQSRPVPICPSLSTVDSCPAGQEKRTTFSSPECGTYYTCVMPDSNTRSCPSGQYWNGSVCVSGTGPQNCSQNQYWNGTSCVYIDEVRQCPAGQYWDGKACVTSEQKCVAGQYWFMPPEGGNGYCKYSQQTLPSGISYPYTFSSTGFVARGDFELKSYCGGQAPGSGAPSTSLYESAKAECQKLGMPWGVPTTYQGVACDSYTTQTSCTSWGCAWRSSSSSGPYCFPPSTTNGGSTYPGDANSCPGFSYSRWNNTGKRYCQLNTVRSCSYDYPAYLTQSNYKPESCPATDTSGTGSTSDTCTQELINLLGTGCHNMGNAWFNSEMNKYVFPGTNTVKDCSTSYISSCTPGTTTSGDCSSYGTGWHTMDSSGNCFNPDMTQYKTTNGTLYSCSTTPTTGCSGSGSGSTTCPSGQYWNGSSCVNSTSTTCPSGQYWTGSACVSSSTSGACPSFAHDMGGYCMLNNDTSRCASYPNASADVNYTTSACTQGSGSTSCPSGQYWNGSSCVNSTSTTCPSGQYWNGSSCVSSTGTTPSSSACESSYGTGWHTMDSSGNCFNPDMTQYKTTNGTLYSCSTTPATGCSGSGSGSTTCPSGQYWNGSSCVNSTSTTCPSGQYWNGSSCVSSSTTSCPSGQYWNGTACVTSSSCSTPSNCFDQSVCTSSGWYWYNSGCWSYPSPTPSPSSEPTPTPTPSPEPTPAPTPTSTSTAWSLPYNRCPSNHFWNGSYCLVRVDYTAHFLAKIRSSVRDVAGVVGGLFGF